MLAIDVQRGLTEAWSRVATFVPKLLGFFAILIIGYFIAKALAAVTDRILERVGFDGWVERGSLARAFRNSKFDPSDMIAVVVFWAVFLIALQLAFGVFGPNPVSTLLEGIIAYLPNLLVAVIIIVIAAALARVVTDVLGAALGAVEGGRWIALGAGTAILVLGVFAALSQLKIAPAIVNGLFYAILAIIVGSAIVAIGGGGIQTMRRYWERASQNIEGTTQQVKANADPEAGRDAAQERITEERARMESAQETQRIEQERRAG